MLILALLVGGCAAGRATELGSPAARVDHVIVGTADLEAGMAEIERLTGVRPALGGSHPGFGTRNALMSLGSGIYLELLAPDPEQAATSDERRSLQSLHDLTPIGWAVSGSTEAALRSRFAGRVTLSPSEPGFRRKPDGSVLNWVTFGYSAIDNPLLPFFIIWADSKTHPSQTSPAGCRLGQIELRDSAAGPLREAIAPLALPVSVTDESPGGMTIELSCPRGELTLR